MGQEWPYWLAVGIISMLVIALLIAEPIIDYYQKRKMEREFRRRTRDTRP